MTDNLKKKSAVWWFSSEERKGSMGGFAALGREEKTQSVRGHKDKEME